LCRAGISNGEDGRAAIKSGIDGVLLASAFYNFVQVCMYLACCVQ